MLGDPHEVDITAVVVEEGNGTPIVLLRETAEPNRILPIFIGGMEAISIAAGIAQLEPDRPLTHDLMATLLTGLDTRIDRVDVVDIRDGAYIAQVTIETPAGARCIDSRPSDAIALATRTDAPVYVDGAVLDAAGLQPVGLDDDDGDDEALLVGRVPVDEDEVEEFREFLADLTPDQFRT